MRPLTLAALAAIGLAAASLPAAAVPAGPLPGLSGPSEMIAEARMRRRVMRRPMTWVQRRGARR